jgi:hypothetical protein
MLKALAQRIASFFWIPGPPKEAGEFDMPGFMKAMEGFDKELAMVYRTAQMQRLVGKKEQARFGLLMKWQENGCRFMRRSLHPAHYDRFVAEFVKQAQKGENFKKLAYYLGITSRDMSELGARMRVSMKQH